MKKYFENWSVYNMGEVVVVGGPTGLRIKLQRSFDCDPTLSGYVVIIDTPSGPFGFSNLEVIEKYLPLGKNIVIVSNATESTLAKYLWYQVYQGWGNISVKRYPPVWQDIIDDLVKPQRSYDMLAQKMVELVDIDDISPGIFAGVDLSGHVFVDPDHTILSTSGYVERKSLEMVEEIANSRPITYWTDQGFHDIHYKLRFGGITNRLLQMRSFENTNIGLVISNQSQADFDVLYPSIKYIEYIQM